MESKKNWRLAAQIRDEIRKENKYMITKRQEVSEALKETLRISMAIK